MPGRDIVGKVELQRLGHLGLTLRVALILLAMVVGAAQVQADEIHCLDSREERPVYYNEPSQVSLDLVLMPPPVAGSKASQEDIYSLLKVQKNLTPQQIQSARDDACESVFRFQDVMGPDFTPARLPFATGFFERVFFDSDREIRLAKEYFKRQRPSVEDPRIKQLIDQSRAFSYPSGHATFAYTNAIILANMVPEKAAAIFKRADMYAGNRAVAGVHYPADILAGRISAAVIDNAFFHNQRFLNDYARARLEVRRALGLKRDPN